MPLKWHEGPDIDELARDFPNRNYGHQALVVHLVETLKDHRRLNEKRIVRLNFWIGIQAGTTFVGTCVLVGAILALG